MIFFKMIDEVFETIYLKTNIRVRSQDRIQAKIQF
jgi:hypothetical protein